MPKFVFLLLLLLSFVPGAARTTRPVFYELRLDNTNGLSSQKVFSFVEDSKGAIWISTKGGVDRFNGRELKNYAVEGTTSLGDKAGRIIRLCIDNDTINAYENSGKTYRYRPEYDDFCLVANLTSLLGREIVLNKMLPIGGCTFYAANDGLYRSTPAGDIRLVLPGIMVNDIIAGGGYLFAATSSGLKIMRDDLAVKDVEVLKDSNIQSLFYDSENNVLFIGAFNTGLFRLDLSDFSVEAIHPGQSLLSKPIRSIIRLGADELAVGVDGAGVFSYNIADGELQPIVNTELDADFAFTGNGIYALAKDSQNHLWIGTYTGGVTMVDLDKSPLQVITHTSDNSNSLVNNNVNHIIEGADGRIHYATDRGVSTWHPATGRWSHTLDGIVVVTLCRERDGNILAGCYGEGIFRISPSGKILGHWQQNDGGLSSNYIFSIKIDKDNRIWIGSPHSSLIVLNADGTLHRRFEIDNVMAINVLDDRHIAASTGNGFYIVDTANDSYNWFASFQEQADRNISAYIVPMFFDNDSTVWLGTEGGGLNHYDLATRRIIREIRTADGLPSNDIYGLVRDNGGRLWASTGNGLAIIGDSIISNLNFINGAAREYNKSSIVKTKSGELIFGSTAGAVMLQPDKINSADFTAPLELLKFTIDGLNEGEAAKIMPELYDMLRRRQISLAYNHNSFDVEFEAINIAYRSDIVYKYMLEGYDHDWSEAANDGNARFRNVPPGRYTLLVKAFRKSDGSTIDHTSLDIAVRQPWWNTIFAKIVYLAIVLALIYFIIRYKGYQLRKEHDEDKIRFFINTAHDIRTPLSLVMSPIEELRDESNLSDRARYLLDLARANMRKLNAVTAQLLEFEKIDSRKEKVKLEPVNLNYLMSEEVSCFANICEKRGIELRLDVPDSHVVISADRHLLELMLDNLLSNACKYTNSGGTVSVALTASKSQAVVRISDTGIGIPLKEQKNIFMNVYRAENARASQQTGNGFGLLQVRRIVEMLGGNIKFTSKESVGTSFTITFRRVYDDSPVRWNTTKVNEAINEIGEPSQAPAVASVDKSETLLIVEDNDDLRNYLQSSFSGLYNVVTTSSAEDALTFLENHYPDIIISDVMMPGMQGDEFCSLVKNNPMTAGIPLILLTAKANHDAVVEGLEKGADDYIAKPFSLDILKSKVKGMLRNRERIRNYLMGQALAKVEAPSTADNAGIDMPDADKPGNDAAPAADTAAADKAFVDKAADIVIANMADPEFDINQLCREMAMSRTLFFGRLKSLTGKAPQDFIRILRLERAAELLKAGGSVASVALDTGFANTKYFSTVFKKHFGIPPSKLAGV